MHPDVWVIEALASWLLHKFLNATIQCLARVVSCKNGTNFGMHSKDTKVEQTLVLEERFRTILMTRSWKSVIFESRIFKMETRAPDAAILDLQLLWPDNTSIMSRTSVVTSESRNNDNRLYASSFKYCIPLLQEAHKAKKMSQISPLFKRSMIIKKAKQRIMDTIKPRFKWLKPHAVLW